MRKIFSIFIAFSFNQVFAGGNSVGTFSNSQVGTLQGNGQGTLFTSNEGGSQVGTLFNSSVGNFKTTHGGETLHALGGGSGGGVGPRPEFQKQ